MDYLGVGNGGSARVVLERETRELVRIGLLESAVADLHFGQRLEHGDAIVDFVGDVACQNPFGEVRITGRENAVAVADGEDGRNNLQPRPGRGGFHSPGVAEIAIVHAVENLELVVCHEPV